jgi:hypothetical protein
LTGKRFYRLLAFFLRQCPSQTQLTNRLKRTVTKAGMQPWVNLRSSCESHLFLVERFDIEAVSGWLGNSPEIVRKHYLQFLGEDIDRAAGLEKFANSLQNIEERESTPVVFSGNLHNLNALNAEKYT